MEAVLLQLLNGLDKGGAYALIALGLTLVFGTLGVVNFSHGALFMLGAFCAVSMQKLLTLSKTKRRAIPCAALWTCFAVAPSPKKPCSARKIPWSFSG